MVAVGVSLLSAAPATADRLRRVGVVVTLAVNAPRAEKLASTLGDALRESLVIDVIAGEDVTRRLPAAGIRDSCVADAACIDDLANRLDADELLMLVVVRVGDRIQIDSTWVNAASKRAVSRPAIAISVSNDDAATVLTEAAPQLLPDAPRRSPGDGATAGSVAGGVSDGLGHADTSLPATASGRRITTGVWVTGAAAGVTLLGGVAFGLAARGHYQDLEGCADKCAQGDLDTLRRLNLTADVLFGTAIACAGTAAVLYYLSDGDEPAAIAAPALVTDEAVGVAVGGVF